MLVPSAELAIVLHLGSFAGIEIAYGELGANVMRHEIGVEGTLREFYLVGFLDTRTEETEVGWPDSAPIPDSDQRPQLAASPAWPARLQRQSQLCSS